MKCLCVMFLVFPILISYCHAEEKTTEELIKENEDLKRELLELRKQVLENHATASVNQTTVPFPSLSEEEDTDVEKDLPGKDAFADEYDSADQSLKISRTHDPEHDLRSSSQSLIFKGEIIQTAVLPDEPIQNEDKDKNQDEDKSEGKDHDEKKDENKLENEDKEGGENKEEDTKEEREDEGKRSNNEEFVITPTRTKQLLKNTGSSVSVITGEDIKNSKAPLLLDVLRRAPGLEVARTGGIGGTTSMFIRGASSAQTLVFVDGIQMNSPTTGAFNFANLTTDNIERVEILRGPQSTLYGSEAIGGVVNIFTKRGAGDTAVTVGTEYGMHDTYRETASVSGGKEKFDYSLGASYLKTHGISSASSGDEADGYENFTGSTRVGWNFMDDGRIDATVRAAHSDLEYDTFQFGVGPVDDTDRRLTTDEVLFSTKINKTFFDIWTPSFLISVNDTELKGFDPTNTSGEFRIPTRVWRLEHQSDFVLFDIDTVTFGYEYEVQEGENVGNFDKRFWNNSVFFQNQIELFESFNWTAGFRYDDYSTFGNNLTYRTTVSYGIEEIGTRFHGSWGTGFRAPSLNELFFPFFGNPNLNPEESKGWDFGIEKEIIKEKLTMDITYFENDFTNLITAAVQPDGSFLAENVARAESEGIESTVTYRPLPKLSLIGTYTYTETTDRGKDQQLPRRPRNRATLGMHTQPLEKLSINVTGVMARDRIDSDSREMDNYWTVDQVTRYDITKLMTAYIRFENLFDYDYEEVTGFGSLGFTAYGGLEFKF
ncbi:MAG: TonB-dependent receptor [Candidatus Jettenia caeni]|nr:MAG: TonB-dependent receptor [Candidatus Jettenia caeni]GJQ45445.1 MAG: TonB-dependent receptor [Candidatus Jettenia caeni]